MNLPECGQTFLDRYELLDVLGEGGTGRVYRANDVRRSELVAIKVLQPERGAYSAETVLRFEREAHLISRLSDPRTVTMNDFGRAPDGLLYMVFELAPGEDLFKLLQSAGRLDISTTIHILAQVLLSLREAHAAGVLHRDIKPENIRVFERDGEIGVKVLDFGIARPIDRGALAITRAGEVVGTPRYMSPEQLTDAPLTPASDIYALGMVGFEMLMGSEALHGNAWNDQIDRLHSGHVFSVTAGERDGLRLAAIIAKMSARKPSDRYQTADAVLAELAKVRAPRPETLPTLRAKVPRRLRPRTTRERAVGIVAGIPRPVLVALAVLMTVAIGIPVSRIMSRTETKPVLRVVRAQSEHPNPLLRQPVEDLGAGPADRGSADAGPPILAERASAGCGRRAPHVGTDELVDLTGVPLLTHVPVGYDPSTPHPVVVLFHQDTQAPADILNETKLAAVADDEGFIIIAPASGGVRAWVQDLDAATARVVEHLEMTRSKLCVDTGRIFALGHGPGGRGVMALRCAFPGLAGIATTAYRTGKEEGLCDAFAPIPYLHMAHLNDRNAPLEGGAGCSMVPKISLAELERRFRNINGCKETRRDASREPLNVCSTWSCEAEFVSCHYDSGRGWPGSGTRLLGQIGDVVDATLRGNDASCDGTPADYPLGQHIWKFFASLPAHSEGLPP